MPQSVIQPVYLSVLPPPLCPWGLPTCNGLFQESSSTFQLNPTSSFSCQLGLPSSEASLDPHDQVRHHFPSLPQHPHVPFHRRWHGPNLSSGLPLQRTETSVRTGTTSTPLVHKITHPTLMTVCSTYFFLIYFLIISLFFKLNISSQEWNVHQ